MRFEELLDRHERGYLTQAEVGGDAGGVGADVPALARRATARRARRGSATGGSASRRRGGADEGELARARALYAEMYGGSR